MLCVTADSELNLHTLWFQNFKLCCYLTHQSCHQLRLVYYASFLLTLSLYLLRMCFFLQSSLKVMLYLAALYWGVWLFWIPVSYIIIIPPKTGLYSRAVQIDYTSVKIKSDTFHDKMSSRPPESSFISFSPLNVTFLQRCREQLGVWGAEPADCCSLQGAPDPSLRVWRPPLLPTGAGWVCCWSAGWPTCLQTHRYKQESHTHTHIYMQETACSNATDVHMLSNKLRPNDEQHMTCRLRLHAQQYNRDYVNTFILSVHQQSSPLCESGVLRY